jgi:hypothetical protein
MKVQRVSVTTGGKLGNKISSVKISPFGPVKVQSVRVMLPGPPRIWPVKSANVMLMMPPSSVTAGGKTVVSEKVT